MQELGADRAAALKRRLADLRAARVLDDLPFGYRPDSDHHDWLAIDLDSETAVFLQANHRKNPTDDQANIDWPKVRRLKVAKIGGDGG